MPFIVRPARIHPGRAPGSPGYDPEVDVGAAPLCPGLTLGAGWKDQGRGRNTAQARGPSVESLITVLGDLPAPAVYVVAALLVFAETGLIIGLVLPGEMTLLFVGFLAYAGAIHPVPAALVLTVAALAGDGRRVLGGTADRAPPARRPAWAGGSVTRRWDRTAALLDAPRRTGHLHRPVRGLRPDPDAAPGRDGRPCRTGACSAGTLLGVVVQVVGSVALGYLVGGSYALVAEYLGRATGALFLLVLVIVALVVFGRYIGRHPDPVTAFGDRIGRLGAAATARPGLRRAVPVAHRPPRRRRSRGGQRAARRRRAARLRRRADLGRSTASSRPAASRSSTRRSARWFADRVPRARPTPP